MTRLLHLDASPRPGRSGTHEHGSHSRRLSHHFIEHWKAARPRDAVTMLTGGAPGCREWGRRRSRRRELERGHGDRVGPDSRRWRAPQRACAHSPRSHARTLRLLMTPCSRQTGVAQPLPRTHARSAL